MTVKGSVWVTSQFGAKFGIVYGTDDKGKKFVKVGQPQPRTAVEDNASGIEKDGASLSAEQINEVHSFINA